MGDVDDLVEYQGLDMTRHLWIDILVLEEFIRSDRSPAVKYCAASGKEYAMR